MVALTEAAKLNRAVRQGDWSEASALVARGVKPAQRTLTYAKRHYGPWWDHLLTRPGRSPIVAALTDEELLYRHVLRGNRKAAEALMTCGVVPDERMLLVAVNHLDVTWVKLLAEGMAAGGVELPSEMVLKALHRDNKAAVLLEAGAVPDEKAVLHAVATGSSEMLKKLLAAGGPATPAVLARAMKYPDLNIVRMLLKAGAVPDEETVSNVIHDNRDSGWVSMLLDARAAAGHEPTPVMLAGAIGSRSCGGSAVLVADDLIKRGVVPSDGTVEYAVNHGGWWIEMLLEAMVAAGREPTPAMLDAALDYGRKDLVQKLQEATNDDKKTATETYNKVAVKSAPKLVQGASPLSTPRLVRNPSLKKGL